LVDACIDGPVRSQDSAWVVARLLRNRHVRRAVWRRVRERFDDIVATVPPVTQKSLAAGISGVAEADLAREVTAFFAETPMPAATKTITQSLEHMEATVAFAARETSRLGEALESPSSEGPGHT